MNLVMIMKKLSAKYLIFIIPTIAFIVLVFTTRFNIGISPDSIRYISAAQFINEFGELRSIHKGLPLEYMTHFPPVVSIMLWLINFFTNNLYDAFVLLNAVSIFAFLLSIALVYKTKLNTISLVVLQLLVMINMEFFALYEMAWSEPLFIVLSFVGLYYLNLFVNKLNTKHLIISALIISVATITRYVGIFLIASSVLYLWLLLRHNKIWYTLKQIFIFGIISSSGFLYWMLRNIILSNNATNREISFHLMSIDYYKEWLLTTSNYFTGFSTS